jgi:hypothetical protein
MQIIATVIFALAVVHTFMTSYFAHLAQRFPAHAGLLHLLGEVEVVFGVWAAVMIAFMFFLMGQSHAVAYLDSCNFVEPLFVFAIMVVAASRPITSSVRMAVKTLATGATRAFNLRSESIPLYFLTMTVIPLCGSLITEPAAMTLAALMLRDTFVTHSFPSKVKYATLGVLFVNVSIGGALTPYAAPPVLMVASQWGWDLPFMFFHFGWRSVLCVLINVVAVTFLFRKDIGACKIEDAGSFKNPIPSSIRVIHFLCLIAIVYFSHHPKIFLPLLLFYLGLAAAYPKYQNRRLMLRESMLVGFFLGGLVVLGGMQQWWLQDVLGGMPGQAVFAGATALTAVTDNAALTYLGSLVTGTDAAFKYFLVAGAITGGGLTVIANAPNPAGMSILKVRFEDKAVSPLKLFIAAFPPTLLTACVFFFHLG